jgi:hypothetical protein
MNDPVIPSDEQVRQQRAAKVIGVIYLVAMALSMWTESGVRGALYVSGDAGATAANLLAHDALFRAGIAADLLVYLSSLVLAWAFFTLLAPIDRLTALLGAWLRLIEVALCVVGTLFAMIALRLLEGGPHLAAFEPAEVHGLMRVVLTAQTQALNLGFLFLGLGSAVFAALLWRSRYVPRALAGLGLVASLLLAAYPVGALLASALRGYWMVMMAPMFLYEVGLGGWLLVKGIDLEAADRAR